MFWGQKGEAFLDVHTSHCNYKRELTRIQILNIVINRTLDYLFYFKLGLLGLEKAV